MNIWNTVYNVNKLYLHPGSGWTNRFIHNNGTWRVGILAPNLHCSLNNELINCPIAGVVLHKPSPSSLWIIYINSWKDNRYAWLGSVGEEKAKLLKL